MHRVFFCLLFLFCSFTLEASIIKKPPVKVGDLAYKDLACSTEDKAIIHEIIATMGESGLLKLLAKQSHLKEIGSRIHHVHPLKFLSTIFTDPNLKTHMMIIWNDYFKKGGFLDGLIPSLEREADKGKLQLYLNEFADEVGTSAGSLKPYFETREWEKLVFHLIYS